MTNVFRAVGLAAALAVMAPAAAAVAQNWSYQETPFGVTVSNSKTGESYKATSVRAAKKQVKALNKAEKKAEKKSDNVRAEPGAPCNDPMSGVVC